VQINIGDAKKQWESLVERAEAGEEIIIERRGEPIAKLGPVHEPTAPQQRAPRKPGSLQGQIWIADDFDDPIPEFEALFYGEAPKAR
jgi:prevent-host-death family protein